MNADELFFPFDAANLVEERRPMMTHTYFNDYGVLGTNASGNTIKTTTGFGTSWPVGVLQRDMYNLWANVKSMAYHIDVAFLSATDFTDAITTTDYRDMESLNVSGVLRRCNISSGSIFKGALKSFRRAGSSNGRTFVDDIMFDFTKTFYDYRPGGYQPKGTWWWPYIRLNIAGNTGYITNGGNANHLIDMQGLGAFPGIPFEVRQNTAGVPIDNPVVSRADMQVIERYDDITFLPKRAQAGVTEVTITIPSFNPAFDGSVWRDGFADVTELEFGGGIKTTTFTKVPNGAGTVDTIKVIPPAGSRTDVIRFTSVANPAKADLTTDYYNTRDSLVIG